MPLFFNLKRYGKAQCSCNIKWDLAQLDCLICGLMMNSPYKYTANTNRNHNWKNRDASTLLQMYTDQSGIQTWAHWICCKVLSTNWAIWCQWSNQSEGHIPSPLNDISWWSSPWQELICQFQGLAQYQM